MASKSAGEIERREEERWRASNCRACTIERGLGFPQNGRKTPAYKYTNPQDTTGITALDESLDGCENGS
jgi:hypothetical protein